MKISVTDLIVAYQSPSAQGRVHFITIFSVCADTAVAFHRIADFTCEMRIDKAHDRIANGCIALPDGRFASIGRDLKLRVWRDGSSEGFETPHKNSIKCLAGSPDGAWIATGSYTGTIAVFDLAHKKWKTIVRPTAAGISSLTAGPTPDAFTASSYDGQVYTVAIA